MKRYFYSLMIVLGLVLLSACGSRPPAEEVSPSPLPTMEIAPTDTPIPVATPTAVTVITVEIAAVTDSPVPTVAPTCTPVLTASPAPTPEPTPDCLHGIDHPDAFVIGEPVKTEMSYTSDKVSIQIKRIQNPEGFPKPMVCFVADIYIEDITSIRSAWSMDTLKESASKPKDVLDLMARENALLMINGDYVSKWDFGCVVCNGKVARKVDNPRYDACVLLKDGTMITLEGDKTSSEQILAMDPWQAWCFGPVLLDENGRAKTKFNSSLTGVHPRTAVGYYAPGHYCFVVVDGRRNNYSKGMTFSELSRFMESLGCAAAYNMDGGGSSVMAFDGRRLNKPSDNRKIPDVIYICEPRKEN